jgi:hypothetical protein
MIYQADGHLGLGRCGWATGIAQQLDRRLMVDLCIKLLL